MNSDTVRSKVISNSAELRWILINRAWRGYLPSTSQLVKELESASDFLWRSGTVKAYELLTSSHAKSVHSLLSVLLTLMDNLETFYSELNTKSHPTDTPM